MKKMTTLIAIILLAALLFTGCTLIPIKHNFSQYGFWITIAGEVTEKEGNSEGNATLYTKQGTIILKRMGNITAGATETAIALMCDNKETLDNGATYYKQNTADGDIPTVTSHYFISVGGDVWYVTCVTPEKDYNRKSLVNVLMALDFVVAQED